jgi:molybdenum cofactor synthesis domain-containing protein
MSDTVIKAAIITVSDTRTVEDDISGRRLADLISSMGGEIVERVIIKDDLDNLRMAMLAAASRKEINLIITTGGTGVAPRDITPEATRTMIEREVPGMAEAMRRETAAATPASMLSRGICGVRGKTLIINLPGSPKGVTECFEVIRPVLMHGIDLISGETSHE